MIIIVLHKQPSDTNYFFRFLTLKFSALIVCLYCANNPWILTIHSCPSILKMICILEKLGYKLKFSIVKKKICFRKLLTKNARLQTNPSVQNSDTTNQVQNYYCWLLFCIISRKFYLKIKRIIIRRFITDKQHVETQNILSTQKYFMLFRWDNNKIKKRKFFKTIG